MNMNDLQMPADCQQPAGTCTQLRTASERVTQAKAAFTSAAVAAINGDPGAEHMAKTALAELDAARAELKQVHDLSPVIGVRALLHS